MTGKTKSILLQVAYKGVVVSGRLVTAETITADYNLLVELHEKLGIDAEDAPRRSNSGGGSRSGSAERISGIEFVFEGTKYEDFRAAKESGLLKANYPDFMTADRTEVPGITNARGSAWMFDQNNNAKPEVKGLVEAADAAAVL